MHEIYRDLARGVRRVRPAADGGRRGVGRRAPPGRVRQPGGAGPGLQLRPAPGRWDAAAFPKVIDDNLALAAESGASSTWVFSNHDVVRHVTRYGLPNGTDVDGGGC